MQKVMTIARAETRLTRRLVRYWLFLALSYLIAIIFFLIYSGLHGAFSSYSATAALFNPRFLVRVIGLYYLWIYMMGTVFLGFDVRARDQRERMTEVLDSRPYTNLELVSGRFLGLFFSSWIPIVVMAIILQLIGLIPAGLGTPFGATIEIWSLFAFVFLMAIPALAFVLSLVFLVTLLIRNRLMAAVMLLVLLGGDFWAIFNLPLFYSPFYDLTGSLITNDSSEIVPALTDPEGWLQRTGVLLAALGMLGLCAAVHPRLDRGSRAKTAAGGIGIIILALAMTASGFYQNINAVKMSDTWKKAHIAAADAPVPDVRAISGEVQIDPGKALDLDLDLTFRIPDQKPLKNVLFTLNPGQKIKEALDASGQPLSFTHENGLLKLILPRPLKQGEEITVHLCIQGLPDPRFGYLESAISTENLKASQGDLALLGLERYIFDSRFVALMPGIRWLPASGPEKDRDDPRIRGVDYFIVDLKVDLPKGWLAGGPGRRHKAEGEVDRVKFRFSPAEPVPEVALIASKFESRSFEVQGVMMEILIHPKHIKNIELLADAGEKIRSWIGERLREAKEHDLGYPYDGLTLVEVPNTLRSYGGGWRMDTAMAPPGLLLMREMSFPTARFDWAFRNPEAFRDKEGGLAQAKWERLRTHFINDVSGENIFSGAAKNFFLHQTSALGPEALALNFVMETISTLLIAETRNYFSAHDFAKDDGMGSFIGLFIVSGVTDPSSRNTMADTAIDFMASEPEVWEQTLKVALKDIDPWEDPSRTVDVLILKAGAMARCIMDILGHDRTGQLLSSLRESHKGRPFSFEDMKDTGNGLGIDFDALFGDWLGSTALPGFIGSSAEAYRLTDSKEGMPRYQLLISVRNDELVPGVLRFRYRVGAAEDQEWIRSDPLLLQEKSAIRFGIVLSQPPEAVWLEPYISLNQIPFMIPLKRADQAKIKDVEAIEGLEELPWTLPKSPYIITDDLDEGFEVFEGEEKKDVSRGFRLASAGLSNQGVSTATSYGISPTWSRLELPGSWGKYRHTTALVEAGDGTKKAVFIASIHKTGSWDLELHMPDKQKSFPRARFGTWTLVVKNSAGDSHEIEFNSNAAFQGWNPVETLDLSEGAVSVTVLDKTDGDLVVADAIRWSPSVGK
jgi:ABC-type transport system involved in multi-copper enzyme maturation permease subunit